MSENADKILENREELILKSWKNDKTFEKSLDKNEGEYIFYDGPPFANGLPHYGHLLTGFVKDVFARYHTMFGEKCDRKFGWDCHGLPAEMEAEKELKITGRLAIKEFGIDKFNEHCKNSVMKYTNEWEYYVTRQGRWVDFENSYKTMDLEYMESVIWAFSELFKKGLIYESTRVMPYSWKCETPLSNFETKMDNSYREKESKTCVVKFKLTDKSVQALKSKFTNQIDNIELGIASDKLIYILAWTTTPWTLPSNLALAVGKDIEYSILELDDECHIIAKSIYEKADWVKFYQKFNPRIINGYIGEDLKDLEYEPLFPYFSETPNAFRVLIGDFVSTEEGTGIVHMAPGFGEDDFNLCRNNNIPVVCPIDDGGKFCDKNIIDLPYKLGEKDEILKLFGRCVLEESTNDKGKKNYDGVNEDVIKYLKSKNLWLKTEQYFHNYPHCWRTDTPLIYKAVSSWYVNVAGDGQGEAKISTANGEKTIKERMMELNSGRIAEFETARLKARKISLDDLDFVAKLRSNPEVMEFYPEVENREMTEEFIKKCIKDDKEFCFTYYSFFEKNTDKFVGIAGFKSFFDECEIGITLEKEFWGKTLATEIMEKLFQNSPKSEIIAWTLKGNLASEKLLHKFCFQHEKESYFEKFNIYTNLWKKKIEKPFVGINWIPENIRDGQFGKWLEGSRDWSISRNRFFGCPIPVWRSYYAKDDKLILTSNGTIDLTSLKSLLKGGKNESLSYKERLGEVVFREIFNNQNLDLAKQMRKNPTEAEEKLWQVIRAKRLGGLKFRRQEPLGSYIVDFVCLSIRLIVEVDGGQHSENKECDDIRTRYFENLGFKVIKFWNNEILTNIDGIWSEIFNIAVERKKLFETLQAMEHLNSGQPIQDCGTNKIYRNIEDVLIDMEFYNHNIHLSKSKSIVISNDLEGNLIQTDNEHIMQFVKLYVFKSISEIESFFDKKITDLHRPYIDELTKVDPYNSNYVIKRIEDVFDCWFESGAMPFASVGFKGESEKPSNFPADFIVEYVAQTRGWFYTLMILGTALFDNAPFKNCICHGVILDEKGEKLSKRLKNYPDPKEMFDKYGSDAMRWFMLRSSVMRGNELYMDKTGEQIRDSARMVIHPFVNACNFFVSYAKIDNMKCKDVIAENVTLNRELNTYIASLTVETIEKIRIAIEKYDTPSACEAFEAFLDVLNNWYIRRSKDVFWESGNNPEKQESFDTLYSVLQNITKAVAPMLPFTAEEVWRGLVEFGKL